VMTLVRRALNHDAQETVAAAAELLAELRPPLRDAAQAFAPRPGRPARFWLCRSGLAATEGCAAARSERIHPLRPKVAPQPDLNASIPLHSAWTR